TAIEPNEGFTVTLNNASAVASIATSTASGLIQNDDFVTIIDDSNVSGSYATTVNNSAAAWSAASGQGYSNTDQFVRVAAGTSASWTFSNLPSGTYDVSATWAQFSNRARNATFTVYVGGVAVTSSSMNQTMAPKSDATVRSTTFQYVGTTFAINGENVTV